MTDAQRFISGADERQAELSQAVSLQDCLRLIQKYHRTAQARSRDFVEAFFWLGAAVSRARAYASWGDNYISELRKETAIGSNTLRRSQGFYEVFAGDFSAMYEWVSSWIKRHDRLLIREIEALVRANKARRKAAREQADPSGDGAMTTLPELVEPTRQRSKRDRLTPEARRRQRLFMRVRRAVERMARDDQTYFDVPDAILPDGRVVSLEIMVHYTDVRYDDPRWRYAHAILLHPKEASKYIDEFDLKDLLLNGPPPSAAVLYRCVAALESALESQPELVESAIRQSLLGYFQARSWAWPESVADWVARAEASPPVEAVFGEATPAAATS